MSKKEVAFLEGLRLSSQSVQFIACLHDQNKSGFFGRPAFIQQSEKFSKTLIGWKKAAPPKKPLQL